jgi:hypothetical protein
MILHKDVLNNILSHTCPRESIDDKRTFTFYLCCEEVTINARLMEPGLLPAQYEIDSVIFKYDTNANMGE